MARAVPASRVYDRQDAAGIHRALERYAHQRLRSPPEENLEVFKRNLDINETGMGPQTLSALQRFGYRPSPAVAERAQRSQPTGFGALLRAIFQPRVEVPRDVEPPRPRAVRAASPHVAIQSPRSAPRVVAQPTPRVVAQPAPRVVETARPVVATPRVAGSTAAMPYNRTGFPVPRHLPVGDPRIGSIAISDTSESTARRTVSESLANAGKRITPGRRYAVFLDPMQRSPSELNGLGYVFEGTPDGSLRMVDRFTAGTQPTNYDRDLPQVYRDKYFRSWAFGPPTIDAGLYPNVSTALGGSFGGNFSIGTTPATRYGGQQIPGLNRKEGTEILLHTNTVGSLGCIRIEDFERFSRAIHGNGRRSADFDVIVARYSR